MFDRIAGRYDLLNRTLSMGNDILWRRRVAARVSATPCRNIVDLATGTADQLISVAGRCPNMRSAVGLDRSGEMLDLGRRKVRKLGLDQRISLVHGDGLSLPFMNNSADAVTITFGIRNLTDTTAALKEMIRILSPGGKAVILEFSMPRNALFRAVYLAYFRHVLPFVGSLVSGDKYAYNYLNRTVETFPYGDAFTALMRDAGFSAVTACELSFGIATIYEGSKAPA